MQGSDQATQVALVPAPAPPKPVQMAPRGPPPAADLETPEAAAERERACREIFGIEDRSPAADGVADAIAAGLRCGGARRIGRTTNVRHVLTRRSGRFRVWRDPRMALAGAAA